MSSPKRMIGRDTIDSKRNVNLHKPLVAFNKHRHQKTHTYYHINPPSPEEEDIPESEEVVEEDPHVLAAREFERKYAEEQRKIAAKLRQEEFLKLTKQRAAKIMAAKRAAEEAVSSSSEAFCEQLLSVCNDTQKQLTRSLDMARKYESGVLYGDSTPGETQLSAFVQHKAEVYRHMSRLSDIPYRDPTLPAAGTLSSGFIKTKQLNALQAEASRPVHQRARQQQLVQRALMAYSRSAPAQVVHFGTGTRAGEDEPPSAARLLTSIYKSVRNLQPSLPTLSSSFSPHPHPHPHTHSCTASDMNPGVPAGVSSIPFSPVAKETYADYMKSSQYTAQHNTQRNTHHSSHSNMQDTTPYTASSRYTASSTENGGEMAYLRPPTASVFTFSSLPNTEPLRSDFTAQRLPMVTALPLAPLQPSFVSPESTRVAVTSSLVHAVSRSNSKIKQRKREEDRENGDSPRFSSFHPSSSPSRHSILGTSTGTGLSSYSSLDFTIEPITSVPRPIRPIHKPSIPVTEATVPHNRTNTKAGASSAAAVALAPGFVARAITTPVPAALAVPLTVTTTGTGTGTDMGTRASTVVDTISGRMAATAVDVTFDTSIDQGMPSARTSTTATPTTTTATTVSATPSTSASASTTSSLHQRLLPHTLMGNEDREQVTVSKGEGGEEGKGRLPPMQANVHTLANAMNGNISPNNWNPRENGSFPTASVASLLSSRMHLQPLCVDSQGNSVAPLLQRDGMISTADNDGKTYNSNHHVNACSSGSADKTHSSGAGGGSAGIGRGRSGVGMGVGVGVGVRSGSSGRNEGLSMLASVPMSRASSRPAATTAATPSMGTGTGYGAGSGVSSTFGNLSFSQQNSSISRGKDEDSRHITPESRMRVSITPRTSILLSQTPRPSMLLGQTPRAGAATAPITPRMSIAHGFGGGGDGNTSLSRTSSSSAPHSRSSSAIRGSPSTNTSTSISSSSSTLTKAQRKHLRRQQRARTLAAMPSAAKARLLRLVSQLVGRHDRRRAHNYSCTITRKQRSEMERLALAGLKYMVSNGVVWPIPVLQRMAAGQTLLEACKLVDVKKKDVSYQTVITAANSASAGKGDMGILGSGVALGGFTSIVSNPRAAAQGNTNVHIGMGTARAGTNTGTGISFIQSTQSSQHTDTSTSTATSRPRRSVKYSSEALSIAIARLAMLPPVHLEKLGPGFIKAAGAVARGEMTLEQLLKGSGGDTALKLTNVGYTSSVNPFIRFPYGKDVMADKIIEIGGVKFKLDRTGERVVAPNGDTMRVNDVAQTLQSMRKQEGKLKPIMPGVAHSSAVQKQELQRRFLGLSPEMTNSGNYDNKYKKGDFVRVGALDEALQRAYVYGKTDKFGNSLNPDEANVVFVNHNCTSTTEKEITKATGKPVLRVGMGLATHGRGPIGYTREQQPSEHILLDTCIINDKDGVLGDEDACVGVRGRGVGVDRIEIKPHVSKFIGIPRINNHNGTGPAYMNVNLMSAPVPGKQGQPQPHVPISRVKVDSTSNNNYNRTHHTSTDTINASTGATAVQQSLRTAFTESQAASSDFGKGTTGVTAEMQKLRNKFEIDMRKQSTSVDTRHAWK